MRSTCCTACGSTENLQHHHLKPRSMGGSDDETNLIILCGECHAKMHGTTAEKWGHRELTIQGLERAKARGVVLGNSTNLNEAQAKGQATNKRCADTFALRLKPTIQPMLDSGMSYRKIADRLNAMAVPTARGGTWAAAQVSGIAKRLRSASQAST